LMAPLGLLKSMGRLEQTPLPEALEGAFSLYPICSPCPMRRAGILIDRHEAARGRIPSRRFGFPMLGSEPMVDLDLMTSLGSSTLFEASGLECLLDPYIRAVWTGAAVSGPAYPLRCAPHDNLAIQLAMEHAPHGSVLVVDAYASRAGFW